MEFIKLTLYIIYGISIAMLTMGFWLYLIARYFNY